MATFAPAPDAHPLTGQMIITGAMVSGTGDEYRHGDKSAVDAACAAAAFGPYRATTVTYQDVPKALLPSAIADGNPDRIWRRIDGRLSQD